MWVGLGKGGGGQSHTQLDGFKTRVLRAGVSEQQRHLYMTAWRSVSTSTVPPMAVLVLTQRASLLPHQSVAQQRTATPLPAVVMATALQQHTMEVHVLCALEVAVSLTQAQAANCQLLAVHLLTLGAQLPRSGFASSQHSASWGLARSVRAEAQLPVVCIDASLEVALEHLPAPAEPEAVMRLEGQLVSRLVVARGIPPPPITSAVGISGTHLVTGGTGGLGMLTARWLAQAGASALALASRGGALAPDSAAEWAQLHATGAVALVERCDTAEDVHVQRLVAVARQPEPMGMWHSAGVLADGLLPNQKAASLTRVYAPKAYGAGLLQAAAGMAPLRTCVLFSSVAALLGGAGQSNYSAANSALDAHAPWRHANGRACVSVQWGAWAQVGMASRGAASERMAAMEAASGFGRIAPAQGLAALGTATLSMAPSLLGVMPVQWGRVLGDGTNVPAFLSGMTPLSSSGPTMQRMQVARRGAISGMVLAEQPVMWCS